MTVKRVLAGTRTRLASKPLSALQNVSKSFNPKPLQKCYVGTHFTEGFIFQEPSRRQSSDVPPVCLGNGYIVDPGDKDQGQEELISNWATLKNR